MDITLIRVGLLWTNRETGVVELKESPVPTALTCARNPDGTVAYQVILNKSFDEAAAMFNQYCMTNGLEAVVFQDLE